MNTKFYHSTTKKMITAFATIFDNIKIDIGAGKEIVVPLHYTQGETFINRITMYKNDEATVKPVSMPVMGFELISMQYEPERHTGSMNKIQDRVLDSKRNYIFNRVPIGFNFDMFIAVKRFEDGLKIVEQIIPFFTPELVIRVKGIDSLEQSTNIPVLLTSFSHNIVNDGALSNSIRAVTFQLSFTMKGFLYPNIRNRQAIENVIVNMSEQDHENKFEKLVIGSIDGEINTDITILEPKEII